jgi:hypothetical protein
MRELSQVERVSWLATQCRFLQPNSLQTGNFTGKITSSDLDATILVQKTAAPQGHFDKFPKQTIREIFSGKQGKTKRITGFFRKSAGPVSHPPVSGFSQTRTTL